MTPQQIANMEAWALSKKQVAFEAKQGGEAASLGVMTPEQYMQSPKGQAAYGPEFTEQQAAFEQQPSADMSALDPVTQAISEAAAINPNATLAETAAGMQALTPRPTQKGLPSNIPTLVPDIAKAVNAGTSAIGEAMQPAIDEAGRVIDNSGLNQTVVDDKTSRLINAFFGAAQQSADPNEFARLNSGNEVDLTALSQLPLNTDRQQAAVNRLGVEVPSRMGPDGSDVTQDVLQSKDYSPEPAGSVNEIVERTLGDSKVNELVNAADPALGQQPAEGLTPEEVKKFEVTAVDARVEDIAEDIKSNMPANATPAQVEGMIVEKFQEGIDSEPAIWEGIIGDGRTVAALAGLTMALISGEEFGDAVSYAAIGAGSAQDYMNTEDQRMKDNQLALMEANRKGEELSLSAENLKLKQKEFKKKYGKDADKLTKVEIAKAQREAYQTISKQVTDSLGIEESVEGGDYTAQIVKGANDLLRNSGIPLLDEGYQATEQAPVEGDFTAAQSAWAKATPEQKAAFAADNGIAVEDAEAKFGGQ